MTATRAPKSSQDPAVIMIVSPLEQEYVDRIASVDPQRTRIIYRPELMPPTRYIADHDGIEGWARSEDGEREWRSLLAQADVLWDFYIVPDAGPLELSPRLVWAQTTSAGVGQKVRKLGLQDSDVTVTTASGVHGGPLTEFVFASLLFHVKRFRHLLDEQAAHRWERFSTGELTGMKLAIIGPGRIGREVARLAGAFRMRAVVLGRDSNPARAAALGVDRIYGRGELPEMLAEADCLVLCAPHTPETDGILSAEALAALKPGAVFVNIGRGALVDETALLAALGDGRIAFAGLDVFREEPLPPDSPFWDLPNVLINPHSASTVRSENAKLTDLFIRNLGYYLRGELDQMAPVLDKLRLY